MPDASVSPLDHLTDAIPARQVHPGWVYLVGAGPGDPELLTLRAARLLRQADCVVYDNLVSRQILALARPEAEQVYVGKKAANHALPQDEINALLVRMAQAGKTVVRLKGGDPFIFGRGGEEAEELIAAGLNFEVVPGITAAAGIGAYAGIPLTHRDHAQSVTFVTGHLKEGPEQQALGLDWASLARPRQTVVFYMGVARLPDICRQLQTHGLPGDTPAAAIHRGTQPSQKVVVATVDTLPTAVQAAGLVPPTLIIVGQVVQLAPKLAWWSPTDPSA